MHSFRYPCACVVKLKILSAYYPCQKRVIPQLNTHDCPLPITKSNYKPKSHGDVLKTDMTKLLFIIIGCLSLQTALWLGLLKNYHIIYSVYIIYISILESLNLHPTKSDFYELFTVEWNTAVKYIYMPAVVVVEWPNIYGGRSMRFSTLFQARYF